MEQRVRFTGLFQKINASKSRMCCYGKIRFFGAAKFHLQKNFSTTCTIPSSSFVAVT